MEAQPVLRLSSEGQLGLAEAQSDRWLLPSSLVDYGWLPPITFKSIPISATHLRLVIVVTAEHGLVPSLPVQPSFPFFRSIVTMLPFWSSLLAPLALTALHAAADVEFQMMPSIDRWSSSSTDLRPMRALHDSRQPFQMPLCRMHELEEASIETIQSWLEAGSLNSAQLVICYLERIHQLNKHLR